MAGTPLKVKLSTAALGFAGLTRLLGGTNPNLFRWYDTQLVAGRNGWGWPAIVVQIISNPSDYAVNRRMATSFARVQFTIWSTDPIVNEAVEQELLAFLDQFNAAGITGLSQNSNLVVNERDGMLPNEQPPQFQKFIDVKIFDNDLV